MYLSDSSWTCHGLSSKNASLGGLVTTFSREQIRIKCYLEFVLITSDAESAVVLGASANDDSYFISQ